MNEKRLVISNEKKLVINNVLSDSARLYPFLQEVGKELALPAAVESSLNLALEEALVNSIQYAYPEGVEGTITLLADYETDNHMLRFTLIDQGIPFDPTTVPEANTTLALEERPIGGLGIFLIRQIMDKVEYKYTDGSNCLYLWKKII